MPGVAGASGTVVFSTRDGSPFTDAQKAAVAAAVARAAQVTGVTRVVDPFVTQAQGEAQARKIADGRAQLEAAKAQLADVLRHVGRLEKPHRLADANPDHREPERRER